MYQGPEVSEELDEFWAQRGGQTNWSTVREGRVARDEVGSWKLPVRWRLAGQGQRGRSREKEKERGERKQSRNAYEHPLSTLREMERGEARPWLQSRLIS